MIISLNKLLKRVSSFQFKALNMFEQASNMFLDES